MVTAEAAEAAAAGPVAGPAAHGPWRRARLWLALLVALVAVGALIALLGSTPARPLDPTSTADGGSRALARVLDGYGTQVVSESSVADVRSAHRGALVVLEPDAYSAAQLRALVASADRTVLVQPGTKALRAVSAIEPDADATPDATPGCDLPAAVAAGRVDLPPDAQSYVGAATSCYGGTVAVTGRVVVLGSAQLLQNDRLADPGVAALDVNLVSADRSVRSVSWLRAGADAEGSGAVSIWDLFPDATYRAFLWLLVVGLLVVLWRARRLGPPVVEPLPVVVRAAELVEGHGRLYRRAGARDRAAAALRRAAADRLVTRLGLPRGSSPEQIGAAAAPICGWSPAALHTVLAGPIPSDDAALVQLARDLDALEAAIRGVDPQSPPHGRTPTR